MDAHIILPSKIVEENGTQTYHPIVVIVSGYKVFFSICLSIYFSIVMRQIPTGIDSEKFKIHTG